MEGLMAMKKASLDRQKTIDGQVKQVQVERKDHSKPPRPFANPSRFANGSVSMPASKAPFDTDPSPGPSRSDFPCCDAFSGDDLGADYKHDVNDYNHDVDVGATAASSSTPRGNEGKLEPHLIPFNPTPRKLAVVEAFDRENHNGLHLSDTELDNLLDLDFWQ
jgi:hypothetical protein